MTILLTCGPLDVWLLELFSIVYLFSELMIIWNNSSELQRYWEQISCMNTIKKYQLNVDPIVLSTIGTCRRRDWSEFVASGNQNLICTELFDLLDNLLMYDHGVKMC